MKSADNIGLTFANTVLSAGIYQGVVNVELGAFQWSYVADDKPIDPDPIVVCRLRLDARCAQQLYDMLGERLAQLNQAPVPPNGGLIHAEQKKH